MENRSRPDHFVPGKAMHRLALSLILAILPLSASLQGNEREDDALPQERAAILEELRERFEETGSFRALYAGRGRSDEREAEILYDAHTGRIVVQSDNTGDSDDQFLIVSHVFHDEGVETYIMRVIDGRAGSELRIPIPELHNALVNPLHAVAATLPFLFVEDAMTETSALPHLHRGLALEAAEDHLTLSINFGIRSSPSERFEASWLDDDLFLEASDVDATDTAIVLAFKSGREIRIDRATGLLISDVFPDPNDRSEVGTFIRLNESTTLGNRPVPEEWDPDLSEVTFEAIDTRAILDQFEEEFRIEIFRQVTDFFLAHLGSRREIRRLFDERGEEIRAAARDAGYRFGHRQGRSEIADSVIESIVESALRPMYDAYLAQVPDDERLSFAEYLDHLIEATTEDPDLLDLPEVNNKVRTMRNRDEALLAEAPLEIWEFLEILHEEVSPYFIDGLSRGVVHQIIERAKEAYTADRER